MDEGQEKVEPDSPGCLKSVLINLLLLLFGLVLFFLLGEITARVLHLDERERLVMINPENILDFKGLHRLSENPDLVYELRPGAESELRSGRRRIRYVINSHGLRDIEFSEEKGPGVFRILVLGDSMVFGPAVDLEETFVKQLEILLNEESGGRPEFQVLNLGVSGYNTYQEWAMLEDRGRSYDPDLIIVAFCANDVDDPRRHVDAHTLEVIGDLPEALLPSGRAHTEQSPEAVTASDTLPTPEVKGRLPIPFKGFLRRHSAFYRFLTRRYDALLKRLGVRDIYYGESRKYYADLDAKLSDYDTPEWAWLRTQFARFQDFSQETGVPWVLVLLPWQYQLARDYHPLPQQHLMEYAREAGFPAVDLRPAFIRENHWNLYIDMAHFSARGHRLAAEAIFKALKDLNLVPE